MTDNNLFSIIPYKYQLLKLAGANKAIAYYRYHAIDLLTGHSFSYDFNNWIEENQKILLSSSFDLPRVIHLFYELGFLIENEFQLLSVETMLVIDIHFNSFQVIEPSVFNKIELRPLSCPSLEDYKKSFETGYEELLKGNCYQFNLTYPYLYSFKEYLRPEDFLFSLWRDKASRGAYGSATYIPFFKKLFLSNSPECLFQHREKTLSAMPIKGTLKRIDSEDWKPLWKTLVNDKKSQAELYMISDLLRNDLSRIEFPRAQIVKKKFPKLVPGLLHQYSQIDVELSASVNLWKVIEKLFPGGSITGAPKKRSMRLIQELEKRERGFYCGSTLILYKEMKSASINIRSSVVDFENYTMLYQAGGGITLLSEVEDEYKEMTYKRDSFTHTLTL
ncbi:MAG: chorismate-binding protein [Bacteriovorax sp.]|nr:chorismate-binding protein [Bacteriovorax sp.]